MRDPFCEGILSSKLFTNQVIQMLSSSIFLLNNEVRLRQAFQMMGTFRVWGTCCGCSPLVIYLPGGKVIRFSLLLLALPSIHLITCLPMYFQAGY